MPLDKKGGYHANPATASMHDHAQPATQPDPAGTATAGAHAVEIHSPDHPETGDGQNFHLRVHHKDGNMEESKHPSYDEASDQAGAAMGEQQSSADDQDDDDDDIEGADVDDEY